MRILLRSHENNYLAAVARHGNRAGVAHVDISTGEFRVTEMDRRKSTGRWNSLARAKCCVRRAAAACRRASAAPRFCARKLEDWIFSSDYADRTLRDHFRCSRSMGAGWPAGRRRSARPAPSCITCARRSAPRSIIWTGPTFYDRADSMVLDAVTVRNLELVEPLFAAAGGQARYLARRAGPDRGPAWADACCGSACCVLRSIGGDRTAAGRRRRVAAANHSARRTAQATWRHSGYRAAAGQGDAGDRPVRANCWRWAARSKRFPPSTPADRDAAGHAPARYPRCLDELEDVAKLMLDAIADEPPLNVADGGTIRAGFNARARRAARPKQNGRQLHRTD